MGYPYLLKCDPDTGGCDTTFPGDLSACPKCGCEAWLCTDSSMLIDPTHYTYDIETYPNAFTCVTTHVASGQQWVHEISDRRDDKQSFIEFIYQLNGIDARMVGFNNVGFDYPVIHTIPTAPATNVTGIYDKAMSIIKSNDRFGNTVWESDHIVKQIDLFKIHHFDNQAKSTSLKALEFAMRMHNIEDLPFDVGKQLSSDEIDTLIRYNKHDVKATTQFYIRTLPEIALRQSLSEKYNANMTNYSDSKIGSTILISELEKVGIQCFERIGGRKSPRQTMRPEIKLADVIFPYVKLEHPEFQRIHRYIESMTITETKGVFKDLTAIVDGLEYKFGTGGLHAAIDNSTWETDDDMVVEMRDVVSYYPRMSIVNEVFPEHLGVGFCSVYNDLFLQRRSHPKGTPENYALKIALNASYGNSNNKYSPLYDPKFTMAITINGQLLLAMLSEQLIKVPNLTMINVNTDGVGFIYPRRYRAHIDKVCQWWERVTGLELERDEFAKFFQRDVNNYLGVQE